MEEKKEDWKERRREFREVGWWKWSRSREISFSLSLFDIFVYIDGYFKQLCRFALKPLMWNYHSFTQVKCSGQSGGSFYVSLAWVEKSCKSCVLVSWPCLKILRQFDWSAGVVNSYSKIAKSLKNNTRQHVLIETRYQQYLIFISLSI